MRPGLNVAVGARLVDHAQDARATISVRI